MPSGRTHDRITLWSLPGIAVATLLLTRRSDLTLIVAGAFLFSGLLLSPDLDLKSLPFKRWGGLRFIWIPYQKMLSHRSVFSHGFLIGTTLRLLYLFILLLLLSVVGVAIAQLLIGFDWNWQEFAKNCFSWLSRHSQEALALILGLEVGAMSHYLADHIGSAYKRYQRYGWKSLLPKPKKKRKRTRKPSSPRKQ